MNGQDKFWLDSRPGISPNERESEDTVKPQGELSHTSHNRCGDARVRADIPIAFAEDPGSTKATFIPHYPPTIDEVKPGTSMNVS